jgi:hypothetical protein
MMALVQDLYGRHSLEHAMVASVSVPMAFAMQFLVLALLLQVLLFL